MYLSIIIPTYNRFAQLSLCLRSLASQLIVHSDIEVIIVDDHSDIQIAKDIKALCHQLNFSYISHSKNSGCAQARNTGTIRSKGKWIAFLDDDVQVNENWLNNILLITPQLPKNIIAIEGLVKGSGDGLWDREVQNLQGNSFLSCNYIIRRSALILAGGFDPNFSGPFCEDHELTVRLQKIGEIQFERFISVTHLPRKIQFLNHIRKAPWRMRTLLISEFYFYSKHPNDYYRFRNYSTFKETYKSIFFRHTLNCLRRRGFWRLIRKPHQALILIFTSAIEQICSWIFLPEYLKLINSNKNLPSSKRKLK
ncbi:MAG: glycosyltransferase family 2 protein [Fibrobacter sp.]|nr:glycosyltransferase family 2 protein [Fibrobacter sp.]